MNEKVTFIYKQQKRSNDHNIYITSYAVPSHLIRYTHVYGSYFQIKHMCNTSKHKTNSDREWDFSLTGVSHPLSRGALYNSNKIIKSDIEVIGILKNISILEQSLVEKRILFDRKLCTKPTWNVCLLINLVYLKIYVV